MSWIGDKAEAAANVLKELLMQTPAARIARGDLPNVLADLSRTAEEDRKRSLGRVRDAYVGREVNFTPEELESTSAFWNPAGMVGKIVYHGSPHKFDKFDASKIGTGEGAQAYGHGVYLADAPDVAGSYAMAGRDKGISNFDSVNRMADRAFGFGGGDKVKALQYLDDEIAKTSGQSKKMNLQLAKQSIERGDHAASLYKADLPDEWIPKMLDWDKPLSEQPESVKKALAAADPRMFGQAEKTGMTGGEYVQHMSGRGPSSDRMASEFSGSLQRSGIPGIRYLDGGSRGKGQGSYNYVVFPGLEDKVKILERNGQPVNALAEILK